MCFHVSLLSCRREYVYVCVHLQPLLSSLCTASLAEWLRRPPPQWKIPGSNLACSESFSGSSLTSDLKIGSPVATLPGAWCYRVSAATGWSGGSIL